MGGAFPGPGYYFLSLTQVVTSQAGHIKLAYEPLYSISYIKDERIRQLYHILSLLT